MVTFYRFTDPALIAMLGMEFASGDEMDAFSVSRGLVFDYQGGVVHELLEFHGAPVGQVVDAAEFSLLPERLRALLCEALNDIEEIPECEGLAQKIRREVRGS